MKTVRLVLWFVVAVVAMFCVVAVVRQVQAADLPRVVPGPPGDDRAYEVVRLSVLEADHPAVQAIAAAVEPGAEGDVWEGHPLQPVQTVWIELPLSGDQPEADGWHVCEYRERSYREDAYGVNLRNPSAERCFYGLKIQVPAPLPLPGVQP